MSDERADLLLWAIRATQDEHSWKLDEVITRLGALERDFAGIGGFCRYTCPAG